MNIPRPALYFAGAALLVAWFSSAASVPPAPPATERQATPASSPVDGLAEDVQAQAKRLRTRLASAPAPQDPVRNPFAFAGPPRERVREGWQERVMAAAALARTDVEAAPPEPALSLIGIAASAGPGGTVRTAMIATGADELLMAAIGDVLLQQYEVKAIEADAVELAEVGSGRSRRLLLQIP